MQEQAEQTIDLTAEVDIPEGHRLIYSPHVWCADLGEHRGIAEVHDDRGRVVIDEYATTAAAAIEWCDGLSPDDIEPPEEDDGDRPWFGFDDREVLT